MKSYEELMGSTGREVFFRPERRRVRDLLSTRTKAALRIDSEEFRLFDLSMNGVSFSTKDTSRVWNPDAEFDIKILLHGEIVYAGRARIARVESGEKRVRVGLALVKGFLDLPDVRRQHEEMLLSQALQADVAQEQTQVPEAYRAAVAEAVHYVQYYRRLLDHHEGRYSALGEEERHDALTELAQRAYEAMMPPFAAIGHKASGAVMPCLESAELLRLAKEYTETVFTPLVLDVPLIRQAYTKPLGYPGDYHVMLYCYRNTFEGPSLFAKVMHKVVVNHPLGAGTRRRRDVIIDMMTAQHRRSEDRASGEHTFRVTSLGCGPAKEVSGYVERAEEWPGRAHWTLIDQEEDALSLACHETSRRIAQKGVSGTVQCLNLSFAQILQDPWVPPIPNDQDLIFSTGLFDYLNEKVGRELLRALCARLAPGGILAVGNALVADNRVWMSHMILDMPLIYRTKAEMQRLADGIEDIAEVRVEAEPANAYWFLILRKRDL